MTFHLPHFPYKAPVPPRLIEQIQAEQAAGPAVVRCTLADLNRAIDDERVRGNLGLREWGWPSGCYPGRRWYTRPPCAWEAHNYPLMLRPCYLVEITPVAPPGKPDHLIMYRWRFDIEGEDAVMALLRLLGESGTYEALRGRDDIPL